MKSLSASSSYLVEALGVPFSSLLNALGTSFRPCVKTHFIFGFKIFSPLQSLPFSCLIQSWVYNEPILSGGGRTWTVVALWVFDFGLVPVSIDCGFSKFLHDVSKT